MVISVAGTITNIKFRRFRMISVGVDVSKEKSTVCVLKPYGEIVCNPFEVQHVEKELESLDSLLQKLDGEIRVVMEATGIYHLPILSFLLEKGYFVSVRSEEHTSELQSRQYLVCRLLLEKKKK